MHSYLRGALAAALLGSLTRAELLAQTAVPVQAKAQVETEALAATGRANLRLSFRSETALPGCKQSSSDTADASVVAPYSEAALPQRANRSFCMSGDRLVNIRSECSVSRL